MDPTAKVVATEDPEMAANSMQVSTQLLASPPWMLPTMDFTRSTSRAEIPPWVMIAPARMKNGTASSGKLSAR